MPIKAVLFDFMGTCLDWHSSITSALPQSLPEDTRSKFAIEWRHAYFDANAARVAKGLPPEDIDIMLQQSLYQLLDLPIHTDIKPAFTSEVVDRCIAAWHSQPAWPEVKPALERLKESGLEVYVHANGTTRLQLDICRSSGLKFDMLFSSELLGVIKPAEENYLKALRLLKLRADECVMVAAHAYDTRGAQRVGMKTVYVYRWTDDMNEDHESLKKEFDVYLNDMSQLPEAVASLS